MVFNVMSPEQSDATLSLVFKELDGTKDSKLSWQILQFRKVRVFRL